jgi:hypothetical protein
MRVLSPGAGWPELLPAPLKLAVWLRETSHIGFDPIDPPTVARLRQDPGQRPTVALPRLVAGDVVVRRRRWYPGADLVGGTGDLLAVTAWRATHGVPEEVMVGDPVEEPVGIPGYAPARRRPAGLRYADLASALMAGQLGRDVPHRVEEAVPVRDGRPTVEWVLEYDRAPGARLRASRP